MFVVAFIAVAGYAPIVSAYTFDEGDYAWRRFFGHVAKNEPVSVSFHDPDKYMTCEHSVRYDERGRFIFAK